MPWEMTFICLAAAVCALDTTAAWQIMLSQPLVCGTIAGLLVGFPETGVFVGMLLQLLWSGAMPVGSRPMPDAPVGTVSGVWLSAVLLTGEGEISTSFSQLAGLLAAMSVALIGRWTIWWERELSSRFVRRLNGRLAAGKTVNPDLTHALSLAVGFLRGLLLCLLAVAAFTAIAPVLASATDVVQRDYRVAVLVLEGLAIGVLLPVFVRKAKGRLPAFACGIVLALVLRSLSG
jgi:mannose/fructose/N-acetylgalactosamine-specific phosphotransferase system component IIC